MPTEPRAIAVRDLTVRFPRSERLALTGVDLEMHRGERLLVMGPSGSGKSTLLRVLAGIVPQAITADLEGKVVLGGQDTTRTAVPELSARAGILTQNPLDQLCLPVVEDELAFPLENRRVAPASIASRIHSTARRLGIAHLRERRTATLSGGEGQRVALAAALVTEPELLLLDEPTSLLDPAGVAQVSDAVVAADRSARRRTIVLVEHRLDELRWMPERLVLFGADGTIEVDAATEDVFRERGSHLAAAGAWLPFEAEIRAVTGLKPDSAHAEPGRIAVAETQSQRAGELLLRARGATVERDGRPVVSGVDLDLRAGETTVVVGPNGSGKTTLLLGLAGLLPRRGMDGGSVGMIFQHPEHQFLTRSAREEVAYGLPPGDPAVAENLRRYQLEEVAAADPFRLSGGQQRRLSLAAVTVLDREVILADEPTFGQDRRTWRTVVEALAGLAHAGRAVVVATHDLRLAARVADRMLVMDEGRPVAFGTPDAVLGDPRLLPRAGLPLPPLLRWWQTTDVPVRGLVAGLDAVPA